MQDRLHSAARQNSTPWANAQDTIVFKVIIDMPFKMLNGIDGKERNLLLVNRAIDSRLRSRDLVTLHASDITRTGRLRNCGTVFQQKTGRLPETRIADQWMTRAVPEPHKYGAHSMRSAKTQPLETVTRKQNDLSPGSNAT